VPVPIIGYGAGGHAKSLLEALFSAGAFDVVAMVDDDPARDGSELLGVPVVGRPVESWRDTVDHAFVGVGGVVSIDARRTAFARLEAAGFTLPPVVHASAIVSDRAELGRGAQILAGAVVNASARVGDGAIVNTGAIVEHDCVLGRASHLGPRAVIGGDVTIGDGVHLGIGAVIVEGLRIGDGAFVAAGAVVVADVPAGTRVAGVPAKPWSRPGSPA
jgi:sugar O-acyltransferase (sialic acid O-acetyltransferase NeuD family)